MSPSSTKQEEIPRVRSDHPSHDTPQHQEMAPQISTTAKEVNNTRPFTVFISYAQKDEPVYDKLIRRLRTLYDDTPWIVWYNQNMNHPLEWRGALDQPFNAATIILLLISPDFFNSDYCSSQEMKQVLRRHRTGATRVIPLLLSPSSFKGRLLERLPILPTNGQPIDSPYWHDQDEALTYVIEDLRDIIRDLTYTSTQHALPTPSPWYLPYHRNPFFTGRETQLEQLRQHLVSTKMTALTQPRALSGLGGMGKTQIALEYAYRYSKEYSAVLWMHATTSESLLSDAIKLRSVLGLPTQNSENPYILPALKAWLQRQSRWLLILDNVEHIETISRILPREENRNGHILLTTRAHMLDPLIPAIEVKKMEPDEAALLLTRRAHAPTTWINQAAAGALVKELDGFPLAIEQAGAYMYEANSSPPEYLYLYQNRRKELTAKQKWHLPYVSDSVATTWSLSFKKIKQINHTAVNLLRLCAFLDPDTIPEEVISESASHWEPLRTSLSEAIDLVQKYALLFRHQKAKTLQMHQVVQMMMRESMSYQAQTLWAIQAVQALKQTALHEQSIDHRSLERYLAHAKTSAALVHDYNLPLSEAVLLFQQTGSYLLQYAHYRQAELFFQQALTMSECMEEPAILTNTTLLALLATLFRGEGKETQEVKRVRSLLQQTEQNAGTALPDLIPLLQHLTAHFFTQGQYAEAEILSSTLLEIQRENPGRDSPSMLTTLQDLVCIYEKQGKYEQAETLYVWALTRYEQIYGPEYPKVLNLLYQYATLLRATQRPTEALTIEKRIQRTRDPP